MQRADLATLTGTTFDLIVIGGGINGVAIARDAAMRGMTVVLLEREDFGSGTSAWSSRLIHGGLRYLEYREFGLVRESLRERQRLLRNAPHLVKPLPMVIPMYEGAKRGPAKIRAGMALYDALSFDKSVPRFHFDDADSVLAELPGLDPSGLKGGATFYDAQVTFPERLVIEQAISAWSHGAHLANRARVTGIRNDGAVVRGVLVTDDLTGERFELSGRIVVNVAGPWVDQVLLGGPANGARKRLIGGTRGSHLVVERWNGAPDDAIYYESRSDQRPILIIPWNGMVMIGSTDIRFEGDLDRVTATDQEIDYLLAEVNALYPDLNLAGSDILYSYAGIRPLPYTQGSTSGAITRRHFIHDHAPQMRGLWSIVGGKLTTHRSLAEEVVDKAVRALGKSARCETANAQFPGARGVVDAHFAAGFRQHAREIGLEERTADRLSGLYGVQADRILDRVRSDPSSAGVVDEASGAIIAEVIHAVRAEMATSLKDVLLRRTMLAYGATAGIGQDLTVLEIGGKAVGWSKPQQRTQLAEYRDWITDTGQNRSVQSATSTQPEKSAFVRGRYASTRNPKYAGTR